MKRRPQEKDLLVVRKETEGARDGLESRDLEMDEADQIHEGR